MKTVHFNTIKSLRKHAKENFVVFKQCNAYHFQFTDVFQVNFYPTKKTFYIQGANHKGTYNKAMELILMAKGKKDQRGVQKGTRRTLKGKKQRLYDKSTHCFVCGIHMEFDEVTVEHKVPLGKGGSNRLDNLALSHEKCNHERGCSMNVNRTGGEEWKE